MSLWQRWNRIAKLLVITPFMFLMTFGLSACSNSKVVSNESKDNLEISELVSTKYDQTKDSVSQEETKFDKGSPIDQQNTQVHDAGYYLNSNESVKFQQATWNFAKAYFSADQEGLLQCMVGDSKAGTWEKDVFSQLNRLILKWNPQELSTDKQMEVQYEFAIEGEDSSSYLGMVLEYQEEQWLVKSYFIEK